MWQNLQPSRRKKTCPDLLAEISTNNLSFQPKIQSLKMAVGKNKGINLFIVAIDA